MNDKNTVINQLRNDLNSAAQAARILFEESSVFIKDTADFGRKKMGDNGEGAVYVYYGLENQVIYVGQTSRYVKARLYDQTSPHQKKEWWATWNTMRFLPLRRLEDRLILEDLLIIAYSPTQNVKPGSIKIESLFADLKITPNEP